MHNVATHSTYPRLPKLPQQACCCCSYAKLTVSLKIPSLCPTFSRSSCWMGTAAPSASASTLYSTDRVARWSLLSVLRATTCNNAGRQFGSAFRYADVDEGCSWYNGPASSSQLEARRAVSARRQAPGLAPHETNVSCCRQPPLQPSFAALSLGRYRNPSTRPAHTDATPLPAAALFLRPAPSSVCLLGHQHCGCCHLPSCPQARRQLQGHPQYLRSHHQSSQPLLPQRQLLQQPLLLQAKLQVLAVAVLGPAGLTQHRC